MLKRTLTTAVAVGALALTAPAARAEHATFDCRFVAVAEQTLTGGDENYVGYAVGYISSDAGEPVSIRCVVANEFNVILSGSPTGTGTGVAVTAGPVAFSPVPTAVVQLCAEWLAGSEAGWTCFPTTRVDLPSGSDALVEQATGAVDALAGPVVCPLTNLVDGIVDVRGAIDIEEDGDVTVLGIPIVDCPPEDQPGTDLPGGRVSVIFG